MGFYFSPKVVTDGLILYLDAANEKSITSGSTTWYDLKKFPSYDITFYNDTKYVDGDKGSIRFDGANDYANRPYVTGDLYDINLTNQITIDVWVKWDNILRATDSVISFGRPFGNNTLGHYQWEFMKSNSVGGTQFRGIFAVSNTTQTYVFNQVTNDGFFTPNTPIESYRWYNFLYTYNFSTGSIIGYVNGEDAGGTVAGVNPSSLQIPAVAQRHLCIGGATDIPGFNSMLGNIGVIKIYNKVLTPEEVLQNYNALKSRYEW